MSEEKTNDAGSPGDNDSEKAPDQKHSPQHEAILRQQALEQSEVKEVLVFLQKYAKPAAITIAVICALVLADRFFKSQRIKKNAAADTALMQARDIETLEEVVATMGSTPAGKLAMMELAREKFSLGLFSEAQEIYERFAGQHSDHELAAQAELNIITCKEELGENEEALKLYDKFIARNPDSVYLLPIAMLGKARCLKGLERPEEALIIYEDLLVKYPDTEWAGMAQDDLRAY